MSTKEKIMPLRLNTIPPKVITEGGGMKSLQLRILRLKQNGVWEDFIEKCLVVLSVSTIAVLILITLFIFHEGLPFFLKRSLADFLFTGSWSPERGEFGILTMIAGSILVTVGALLVGVPLGVACAIYLVEFSGKNITRLVKPLIELLAAIPSVVYGFLGIMILAPVIRNLLGGSGLSILTASAVLGIMILPTVISISMDSLTALPGSYKEGSIALGATDWQTVRMVLLPAARNGILAAVILGLGRAVGETMAVIMISGNAVQLPKSILDPVRTLTANIALEMGYAIGDHRQALFATAIILFIFIMLLNIIARSYLGRKIR